MIILIWYSKMIISFLEVNRLLLHNRLSIGIKFRRFTLSFGSLSLFRFLTLSLGFSTLCSLDLELGRLWVVADRNTPKFLVKRVLGKKIGLGSKWFWPCLALRADVRCEGECVLLGVLFHTV